MSIYLLENIIQEYEWGSPELIPGMMGVPNPQGTPMAEIWMGTHPKAPSSAVVDGKPMPLPELIAAAPGTALGSDVAARFDGKLPFLFKVLAAEKALSIQSHPNLQQAAEGYQKENDNGISLTAPNRNYRDPNHKPEIICALTPFWAMCGFRPIDAIVANLSSLDSGLIADPLADLAREKTKGALKNLFSFLLELDETDRLDLVSGAVARAEKGVSDEDRWILELNRQFPADIGVLCPLLLNLYKLRPGQAIYLDAGELHAYLHGLGIELMANSDNVLRGGLTPKHIDLPELLSTLTFNATEVPIIEGHDSSGGERVYTTPVSEFRLSRIAVESGHGYSCNGTASMEILINTKGACSIQSGGVTMRLEAGDSVVVTADTGTYEITGDSVLFRAVVP